MSISALLLLALGVSMDNFAVSLAIGTAQSVRTVKPMVRLALMFGVFQVFMPLLGWLGEPRSLFFFADAKVGSCAECWHFWAGVCCAPHRNPSRFSPASWSLSAPHLVWVLRQALTRWSLALVSP